MKQIKLVLSLLSVMTLAGCFNTNKGPHISSEINYDSDQTTEITDEGDENVYDSEYVDEDVDITPPSSYDEFSDGTLPDLENGHFYLRGNYDKIFIAAKKDRTVYVYMDGASINCITGIAFESDKAINLYLILLNNSVNSVVNDFLDENAFHVKGNVHILGSGTLNIESKQKNGLKASKNLYVVGEGLTLNVKGANHAITAQSITVKEATINVTSLEKDGIQVECDSKTTAFTKTEGFAYFVDAKITADTYGDGIQADTYVYISGGEFDITTHGVFVSYSADIMALYGLTRDDFKYVQSNGSFKRVAADEIRTLNSSYFALTNSVKGIKAGIIEYDSDKDDVDDVSVTTGDYEIYIAHTADIVINSTDDCIHANYGKVTLDSSNFEFNTYDDGAHADKDLIVNNSSIIINSSYEGLEGSNVYINGEDTNIVSVSEDDGINAASDTSGTHNIYINDGYLRVFANGDGVDANNSLYLRGGTVIVEGPGRMNGSLDAERIYFEGGIVFACSTSGMRENMTATQYSFLFQGNTMNPNTKISVVNSSNVAIFSYTLKQSCNQLIFSHPDLQGGETYTIFAGGSTLGTVTMSSKMVTVGAGGGGPGGGGWPR